MDSKDEFKAVRTLNMFLNCISCGILNRVKGIFFETVKIDVLHVVVHNIYALFLDNF